MRTAEVVRGVVVGAAVVMLGAVWVDTGCAYLLDAAQKVYLLRGAQQVCVSFRARGF